MQIFHETQTPGVLRRGGGGVPPQLHVYVNI